MIMSVCKEKKRKKVLVHFNEERSVRTICSNGIILKGNKIDNDHRSKKRSLGFLYSLTSITIASESRISDGAEQASLQAGKHVISIPIFNLNSVPF